MRINGKKLSLNEAIIVFPRADGDIVIKARGVASSTEFDKICKPPVPPEVIKSDGSRFRNFQDAVYKAALEQYGDWKGHWTILKSLEATQGIEWEQVKLDDPSTWHLWGPELQESGFSEHEVLRITHLVMDANSLSDEKLNSARKRFLASQAEQSKG